MNKPEIRDAVIRSFAAYHRDQDGTRLAEQVSPVQLKSKWDFARIRSTIFLDTVAISDVAYCVRLVGPDYLSALSISQITSLLRDIVRENYWRVARDWTTNKGGHLVLEDADIDPVCSHFSQAIVSPPTIRFLFPLTSLKVDRAFEFGSWSLFPPSELTRILPSLARLDRLRTDQMPLFAEEGVKGKPVNCWLVISSPAKEHAQKLKRIVLGAIALCPLRRDRHLFSLRANSDGYCYISDGVSTASSPAHMPPIEDVLLELNDFSWLHALSKILESSEKVDLRKRNALEYYYNAWFLTEPERCAIFFSALEAIFGADNGISTQGLREGIVKALPSIKDGERLKTITDLRNSIVHGGAPDAYSSKNYRKYYSKYKYDILDDIEIIAERCLKTTIFGGLFREQPDPHAEIISKFQGLGVLPTTSRSNSILS
jgi:hypothetical protein